MQKLFFLLWANKKYRGDFSLIFFKCQLLPTVLRTTIQPAYRDTRIYPGYSAERNTGWIHVTVNLSGLYTCTCKCVWFTFYYYSWRLTASFAYVKIIFVPGNLSIWKTKLWEAVFRRLWSIPENIIRTVGQATAVTIQLDC